MTRAACDRVVGERGVILIVTLVVIAVLTLIGAGVVTLATTETAIAASYRRQTQLLAIAEYAAIRAIAELETIPDDAWLDLTQPLASGFLDRIEAPVRIGGAWVEPLPLTAMLNAEAGGREWQLFASLGAGALAAEPGAAPPHVLIWVAREADGDDGVVVYVRAGAFGIAGARRLVDAALARVDGRLELRSWHEVR